MKLTKIIILFVVFTTISLRGVGQEKEFALNETIPYISNSVAKQIEENRINGGYKPVTFLKKTETISKNTYSDIILDAMFYEINIEQFEEFNKTQKQNIEFNIPISNKEKIELELTQVQIKSDNYKFTTSDDVEHKNSSSIFYRGIVKGDTTSLVTLSIFENSIRLLIADHSGNHILGKLKNHDTAYIFYNDKNLRVQNDFTCYTPDVDIPSFNEHEVIGSVRSSASSAVEVYIEADFQMYTDFGSSTVNTENYILGLFNEVATLYSNESITTTISQMFVWTSTDPYASLNSTSDMLELFGQTLQNNYSGDLAHLVSTRPIGGGIAWLNQLCNSYYTFDADWDGDGVLETHHAGPYAVSGINTSYSNVPTYSWTIEVFTHEMGHNLGSRHTHACVWGANNDSPIDCCGYNAGYDEESTCGANYSCTIPDPSDGTIMSYCHLTSVGINFNLGFGTEPGDLIRSRVAACLCPEPNLYCQSNGSLNVNTNAISIANYQVGNNGTGSAVASTLGYYLSSNTTISTSDYLAGTDYVTALGSSGVSTESITITPSNINTMPPDGSYYVGMYIDYQNVVAESNESDNNDCYFTSLQVIIGCRDSNAHNYNSNANFDNNNCETCTDGIQNGDETGVDCGGNLCSPCGSNLFCQSSGALNVSPNSINISGTVVSNSGATPPSVSYLGYYLSSNTTISTGDYLIGTDFVPALSNGSTSVESIVVTPSNIINLPPEGNYYVGILVDYQNAISETNENDNNDCYFTTPQVVVGCIDANAHNYNPNATFDSGTCQTCTDGVQNGDETGVDCGGVLCSPCSSNIDLLVSNCGIIDVSGDVITISGVQITNNGNVASGVSELGYYLSTNSIISTGDILIGTDYVTSLGAGSVSNESITVDISTLGLTIPSGSYYIGLLVDHLGAVTETNETNNNDCYDTTDRYHSTTVTNVSIAGFGSLDQAIICANTRVGADVIDFAIGGSGVFTISPTSAITYVTDDNTVIDVTTQPNWYLGQIVLDGSNTTNAYGIVNNGSDNFELYGLKIQNFDYAGIWTKGDNAIIGDTGKGNVSVNNNFGLYIRESANAQIYDNYFGVLEDNVTAAGNDYHGIRAIGLTNCTIGKSGAGNTIGANNYAGIGIGDYNYTDSDYSIRYNYIGTSSADVDLGNKRSGIDKQPTVTVTDIDIWNNTIAYNDIYGVWVYDAQCTFWDPYYNSYYCNTSGGLRIETGSNNGIVPPTITNATTSIIEGTGQAGAYVEVRYRDTDCTTMPCQAKTLIGFDTADSNGNWSVTGTFTSGAFILASQGVNTTDWTTSAFSTCRLIDDCPANLYLSADYNGTLDLEVWNIITADNTILSGADVTYDADDCIELNAGFEVEQGAVFEAKIDGCGGSLQDEDAQK